MKKFQFCIRFQGIDSNSAASKAVLDCNAILSSQGYHDYTFTVEDNSNRLLYYFQLIRELIRFFTSVKSGSLIAIQYPLLSINNIFRYFIQLARIKNCHFFCVVHDLESLRNGGHDRTAIFKEVKALNAYDTIIVHNAEMERWLITAGVKTNMIILGIFDYLSPVSKDLNVKPSNSDEFVFAGNLSKSSFIYNLDHIEGCRFGIYGPNFNHIMAGKKNNIKYYGEYGPNEIVNKLLGKFGLLWDGNDIDVCDSALGHYLKFNNPHKCSLYLAAGIPVIAPRNSAIGKFISENNVGLLIDSLQELPAIKIESSAYTRMCHRVAMVQSDIVTGNYFRTALKKVEAYHEI